MHFTVYYTAHSFYLLQQNIFFAVFVENPFEAGFIPQSHKFPDAFVYNMFSQIFHTTKEKQNKTKKNKSRCKTRSKQFPEPKVSQKYLCQICIPCCFVLQLSGFQHSKVLWLHDGGIKYDCHCHHRSFPNLRDMR